MPKRTLQDWASISDILSGIAVVIALVFVGYELRENTLAMESSTRQEFASQDIAYLTTGLDSSVIAIAQSKFIAGEQLLPLEFNQLVSQQHVNFRVFENAHYQYQIGTLKEAEWGRYATIIQRLVCRYSPASTMWERDRDSFVPDYRDAVDNIMEACGDEAPLAGQ